MTIDYKTRYFSRGALYSGFVVAITVMAFAMTAEIADAAAVTYAVDTNVSLGGNTYIIKAGSNASSVVVGTDTITITTGATDSLTLDSNSRFLLNNNSVISSDCNADRNRLVVTANKTNVIVTPNTLSTCSINANRGGGGGGGGGGGPTTTPPRASTTPTTTTPPAPSASSSAPTVNVPFLPPTTTPTPATPLPGAPSADNGGRFVTPPPGQVVSEAKAIILAKPQAAAEAVGMLRDTKLETKVVTTVVQSVIKKNTPVATKNALVNFTTYGTEATKGLSIEDRGDVVKSFNAAFGRAPRTEKDWQDVIRIATGAKPVQVNKVIENNATKSFQSIYLRKPNLKNAQDSQALAILAYGVLTEKIDAKKEAEAVKVYKSTFKRNPTTVSAENAVKAIAYAGLKIQPPAPTKVTPKKAPAIVKKSTVTTKK